MRRSIPLSLVLAGSISGCGGSDTGARPEDTAAARAALGRGPVVTTTHGPVTGTTADANGVYQFWGIPYAAPPVGALRWRPPQAPASWTSPTEWQTSTGVPVQNGMPALDACMQQSSASALLLPDLTPTGTSASIQVGESEDCLYLNVFTKGPGQAADAPVLVWLHPGGFVNGDSYEWSPTTMMTGGTPLLDAHRDAVVVSVEYRVGPFGFLGHPGLTAEAGTSGTYGMLDQIAALAWVQANIASFGGDPDNVTIAGQSAGAISVSILQVSPLAKGLFSQGIEESNLYLAPALVANLADGEASPLLTQPGSPTYVSFAPGGVPAWPTLSQFQTIGTAFTELLGIATTLPASQQVAAMRALGADDVRDTYFAGGSQGGLGVQFTAPPIDGQLLTASPLEMLEAPPPGVTIKPSIVGSNDTEFATFFKDFVVVPSAGWTSSSYASALTGIWGTKAGPQVASAYPPASYSDADVQAEIIRATTDGMGTCYTRSTVRSSAARATTYRYFDDYEVSATATLTTEGQAFAMSNGDTTLTPLGSFHGIELPFVWGAFTLWVASSGYPSGTPDSTLSTNLQDAWIAFATNGNPNPTAALGGPIVAGGWVATPSSGTTDPFLVVDAPLRTSSGGTTSTTEAQCDFWDQLGVY
jgi:para-nitrobenzyl esterase